PMRLQRAILAGLLSGAACSALGQDGAIDPTPPIPPEDLRLGSVGFYWDNDGAYIKPNQYSDEHYTNGLKIDFGFQGQLADRWVRRLPTLPLIGLDDEGEDGEQMRSALGLGITQLMFTPEDLSRPDVIEDDRPYAGYLGFNLFLQRVQGDSW